MPLRFQGFLAPSAYAESSWEKLCGLSMVCLFSLFSLFRPEEYKEVYDQKGILVFVSFAQAIELLSRHYGPWYSE